MIDVNQMDGSQPQLAKAPLRCRVDHVAIADLWDFACGRSGPFGAHAESTTRAQPGIGWAKKRPSGRIASSVAIQTQGRWPRWRVNPQYCAGFVAYWTLTLISLYALKNWATRLQGRR
jgi:hypothetical protein